jgi:hypothetical protein
MSRWVSLRSTHPTTGWRAAKKKAPTQSRAHRRDRRMGRALAKPIAPRPLAVMGFASLYPSYELRAVGRHRMTAAASGNLRPRIMSEALSAIIMVEALRLAEIMRGMIEASITRRFCNPCTRN